MHEDLHYHLMVIHNPGKVNRCNFKRIFIYLNRFLIKEQRLSLFKFALEYHLGCLVHIIFGKICFELVFYEKVYSKKYLNIRVMGLW